MKTLLHEDSTLDDIKGWNYSNQEQQVSNLFPHGNQSKPIDQTIFGTQISKIAVLEVDNIEIVKKVVRTERHLRYTDGVNTFDHFMFYLLKFVTIRFGYYYTLGLILPEKLIFIYYISQAVLFWVMVMRFVTVIQKWSVYRQKIRDTSPSYKIAETWNIFNGNMIHLSPKPDQPSEIIKVVEPDQEPSRDIVSWNPHEIVFHIDTIRHVKKVMVVRNSYLYSEPANGLNVLAIYVLVFWCLSYALSNIYYAVLPIRVANWYDFSSKCVMVFVMSKRFISDWTVFGRYRQQVIESGRYDKVEQFEL